MLNPTIAVTGGRPETLMQLYYRPQEKTTYKCVARLLCDPTSTIGVATEAVGDAVASLVWPAGGNNLSPRHTLASFVHTGAIQTTFILPHACFKHPAALTVVVMPTSSNTSSRTSRSSPHHEASFTVWRNQNCDTARCVGGPIERSSSAEVSKLLTHNFAILVKLTPDHAAVKRSHTVLVGFFVNTSLLEAIDDIFFSWESSAAKTSRSGSRTKRIASALEALAHSMKNKPETSHCCIIYSSWPAEKNEKAISSGIVTGNRSSTVFCLLVFSGGTYKFTSSNFKSKSSLPTCTLNRPLVYKPTTLHTAQTA